MDKARKPQIKRIRELLRNKKKRDEEGVFVAEGAKIVSDIMAKGKAPEAVFFSSKVLGAPSSRRIEDQCRENGTKTFRVPAAEFEMVSSLRNSQGILGVVRKPSWPKLNIGDIAVLCDGIQDPGNLGSIIRLSAAFGVRSLVMYGGTADIYNPKVVRSSSGAVVDIPAHFLDIEEIRRLKAEGYSIIGSAAGRGRSLSSCADLAPEGPFMIAFGSEGRGLSKEIEEEVERFFHISIDEKVESLNVTAAAAIVLYTVHRQIKGR
jgi:RNA methyltransferase, TrmH family